MTNNNLSCIPFYTSLEEQDFRKWYAYGEKYPFYVPSDKLIPFSFPIPKAVSPNSWSIDKVQIFQVCCQDDEVLGNGSYNISYNSAFDTIGGANSYQSILVSLGLTINTSFSGFDLVVYPAYGSSTLNLPKGIYYIKLTLKKGGVNFVYYSDIFFVDSRSVLEANMVKVSWDNEGAVEFDGGAIPYGGTFHSEIFLDTTIAKPTYNFTEEGEERNGHFFPMKQISDKSYNMSFFAPEYLCDVMRLIRMADSVVITDRLGKTYNVEQFEMDVEWLEQGHYAQADCTFKTDTIVKKVGKAYTTI